MSAIGTRRTSFRRFGMSALGVKRTSHLALHHWVSLPLGVGGRFAPADCFGTILVSIPDASNDNGGDHTHNRGTISVTKSWPMATAL